MSDSKGITATTAAGGNVVKKQWRFVRSFRGVFGHRVLVWKDGQGNQMRIWAENFWTGRNLFYMFPV